MTTAHCRWVATDQPRAVIGRHADGCDDETCRGCLSCTEPRCRVCDVNHLDTPGACPECVAAVRTDLADIRRMCADLPAEVAVRGVDTEAFNLLGPVADAEAWGHRQASAHAGRIDAGWLKEADDERHPLIVLGTWMMMVEEARESA